MLYTAWHWYDRNYFVILTRISYISVQTPDRWYRLDIDPTLPSNRHRSDGLCYLWRMSGFTSLWRHDIETLSTLVGFVLAIILNNLLNKSSVIDDFRGHCACATWVDFTFTKIHNRGNVDMVTLRWRHNDRDGVSNHQRLDCLLNRLCRRRSKKASKLRVTGLCAGNSPVTGEFPSQRASNVENVSIWWLHHATVPCKPKWILLAVSVVFPFSYLLSF